MLDLEKKGVKLASFGLDFTHSGVSRFQEFLLGNQENPLTLAERRAKMTSYKSIKGPARLGDLARGLHANRHGRPVPKNHEAPRLKHNFDAVFGDTLSFLFRALIRGDF